MALIFVCQEVCQASIWRNGDQPRVSCRAALRDGLGCCGVREMLGFFLGVGFEVVWDVVFDALSCEGRWEGFELSGNNRGNTEQVLR